MYIFFFVCFVLIRIYIVSSSATFHISVDYDNELIHLIIDILDNYYNIIIIMFIRGGCVCVGGVCFELKILNR